MKRKEHSAEDEEKNIPVIKSSGVFSVGISAWRSASLFFFFLGTGSGVTLVASGKFPVLTTIALVVGGRTESTRLRESESVNLGHRYGMVDFEST